MDESDKPVEPHRPPPRIMDRKILRSGFSAFSPGSNDHRTGRYRASPLRTPNTVTPTPSSPLETTPTTAVRHNTAGGGSSVRAIVNWIEKSATSHQKVEDGGGTDGGDSADGGEGGRVLGARSSSGPTLRPPPVTPMASRRYRTVSQNSSLSGPSASPTTTKSTAQRAASSSSPADLMEEPEDYSLTLLKYKSYFNNRPLGRCLDDQEERDGKEADHKKKAALVTTSKLAETTPTPGSGTRTSGRNFKNLMLNIDSPKSNEDEGIGNKNRRDAVDAGRETAGGTAGGMTVRKDEKSEFPVYQPQQQQQQKHSRKPSHSVQQLEKLMAELDSFHLEPLEPCSSGSGPGPATAATAATADEDGTVLIPSPPRRGPPRTPGQAKQFWDGVRAFLWIPDEEMEEHSRERDEARLLLEEEEAAASRRRTEAALTAWKLLSGESSSVSSGGSSYSSNNNNNNILNINQDNSNNHSISSDEGPWAGGLSETNPTAFATAPGSGATETTVAETPAAAAAGPSRSPMRRSAMVAPLRMWGRGMGVVRHHWQQHRAHRQHKDSTASRSTTERVSELSAFLDESDRE